MWISVFVFFALLLFILKVEINRRPDVISIFIFIFSIQIVFPGIFLPILIWMAGKDFYLGNLFFDRVYHNLDGLTMILTSLMAVMFILFLYIGYFFLPSRFVTHINATRRVLVFVRWRFFGTLILGVISMLYLFFSMPGADVGAKYLDLVLFRAQDKVIYNETRSFVVSNLFSLAQTFAIFSILLLFYLKDKKNKLSKPQCIIFLSLILFMSVFAASRRMLMIQVLIIYFATVLMTGRWFFKYIFFAAPFALFWLAFGKQLLLQVPQIISNNGDQLNINFNNMIRSTLNAFSSLGISLNSSWATFMFLGDLPPRLGIDHILSVLRFLPLSSLGFDKYELYGPRIVRISTKAFLDDKALDIPPGLIGQMWLDFRVFGPFVWGLIFGVVLKAIQIIFNKFEKSWISCGVLAIIIFVFALPINSGSLDFNFSVDMFFLLLFLWLTVKVEKIQKV